MVHTEFRDGNVPAGYEQLRVLQEALSMLPAGVEKVRLRSDPAGYRHELLRYCERGEDARFGRIEFAIGCDVTAEFKKAVLAVKESEWAPISKVFDGVPRKTHREWAEVCFIPDAIGHRKNAPVPRRPGADGSGVCAGHGESPGESAVSDAAGGVAAVQDLWSGHQRRGVDSPASGAVREIRGSPCGDEEGSGRRACRQGTLVRMPPGGGQ